MAEHRPSREQLEGRREEIWQQLERVNEEQRIELDVDPEEQAIQIEHGQVANSREAGLRRELAVIEEQLLDLDESD